jgi:hypothetical protein
MIEENNYIIAEESETVQAAVDASKPAGIFNINNRLDIS